jgi:hypothetical protein
MDVCQPARHLSRMPTVELTDTELAFAAEGFRRLVTIALEDSKRQTNPEIKLTFLRIAQGHQDTVEKLERARSVRVADSERTGREIAETTE